MGDGQPQQLRRQPCHWGVEKIFFDRVAGPDGKSVSGVEGGIAGGRVTLCWAVAIWGDVGDLGGYILCVY